MFDEAVGSALDLTSEEDTLIVVTADHSHMFSMGGIYSFLKLNNIINLEILFFKGYSLRGNPILGINLNKESNVSDLGYTYTSLIYGNGPGGIRSVRKRNLTNEETGFYKIHFNFIQILLVNRIFYLENKNYIQEAAVYLSMETHGFK